VKTSIPWCDVVWNPVWGCERGCPYCYARGFARRFGVTPRERDFRPVWRDKNFDQKFPKSTRRVFVNSMSDPQYWRYEWWKLVAKRILEHPEIDFIFLTKGDLDVYLSVFHFLPSNVILGLTVTNREQLFGRKLMMRNFPFRLLLNIEPILGDFGSNVSDILSCFDWVIIGAETGSDREKVVPRFSWFRELINDCQALSIPLFVKPSLDALVPEELRFRQYPRPARSGGCNEL